MIKGKQFGSSSGKANKPKKGRKYKKIPWHQCQCSGSSQVPSQDDLNDYHQFLSLYRVIWKPNRNGKLAIYDTENEREEVEIFDSQIPLDYATSITQLPSGELFCYGSLDSGIAFILGRNYEVRMLPSGIRCGYSPALYLDNNIYCFGGWDRSNWRLFALSRKFDLKNNRWINLTSLPEDDHSCHSVIFNKNILISGHNSKNLWLYSIETNSFSIIPYGCAKVGRKYMINAKRLYLIEWADNGLIYESEDEYHWESISKSNPSSHDKYQIYSSYNKEKIYISAGSYYQFDLKKKVLLKIK